MMELGEERVEQWTKKNGGKRKEKMSCDSIKTHQTLPQSVCQLFLTGFATGLVVAAQANT